jgi:UDP-N-acetylglucosamine 2-epimerase (non-hydrolysing)
VRPQAGSPGSLALLSVVGARPNFMKLAPLARVLCTRANVAHTIVHTGQHYDTGMSAAFFEDLAIPPPDHDLGVGSASHAQQTAAIMQRIEPVLLEIRPEVVLVYGDVNSTAAAALVAAKLGIRIGHVEAGLRSRDWTMPEEINRVVTDRLSDLLFTPSRDADENLRAEGVPAERIHFVGNVMIDSLVHALPAARSRCAAGRYGVNGRPYAVVTLHRPSNVDDPAALGGLTAALDAIARERPVIFPVHPRTRARLDALGFRASGDADLRLLDPVGYLDMLGLVETAALVITDSGGLQEETTFLGVPCVTVRPNTERPITCARGTNRLVAPTREALVAAANEAIGAWRPGPPAIERWDGRAAERIVGVLMDGEAYR